MCDAAYRKNCNLWRENPWNPLKEQFQDSPTTLYAIEEIEPIENEYELADWKLQLRGFIKGLASIERLNPKFIIQLDECSQPIIEHDEHGQRVGRENKYSVDICTQQNQLFQFDVAATNPLDSYMQLTKRLSYRAIPGITSVKVFPGLIEDRDDNQAPLKEIDKDELIYVKPLY